MADGHATAPFRKLGQKPPDIERRVGTGGVIYLSQRHAPGPARGLFPIASTSGPQRIQSACS